MLNCFIMLSFLWLLEKKLISDFTPSFLLGELPQNEDTRAWHQIKKYNISRTSEVSVRGPKPAIKEEYEIKGKHIWKERNKAVIFHTDTIEYIEKSPRLSISIKIIK